ncbi:MAG: hypothetical protein COA57_09920 [Flavobacteriales bacterium]|nr:MAG: hypothetical protein COA57_09920 [Flavobacteriales bacterium]
MDKFELTIDKNIFERTNSLWNELMLNDPWSVGYVSTLIESKNFQVKKEWEEFYYHSGENRNKLIKQLTIDKQEMLNNEQLIKTNKNVINKLNWNLKNLNTQYGRTKSQLKHKGEILFKTSQKIGIQISEAECFEAVRFRTICQTWNGIIIQERNTIKNLKQTFSNCVFEKTKGDFDHKYAVDYILNRGNEKICGIQIKPKSYTYDTPYLRKAKEANRKKNNEFKEQFGCPVFNIISKSNGEIINKGHLKEIKRLVD